MNEPAPSSRRFGQKKTSKQRIKRQGFRPTPVHIRGGVAGYFAGASTAAFFTAQRCLAASQMRFRASGLMCLIFAFFASVYHGLNCSRVVPAFAVPRQFNRKGSRLYTIFIPMGGPQAHV
jgi:hypothetical protein